MECVVITCENNLSGDQKEKRIEKKRTEKKKQRYINPLYVYKDNKNYARRRFVIVINSSNNVIIIIIITLVRYQSHCRHQP